MTTTRRTTTRPTTRPSRRLLAAALGATALVATGAGTAQAAPAGTDDAPAGSAAAYSVGVRVGSWVGGTPVRLRDEPNLGAAVDRVVHAGDVLTADCWTYGETVTDYGVSHGIWIQVGSFFDDEYVWAGTLEGDQYAGVPTQC